MEKFYNREQQLAKLRSISKNLPATKGQLSVMVGRRRVGKTRLLNESFSGQSSRFLYLFISRKSEAVLVDEFATIIRNQLEVKFYTIIRNQLGVKFFQPSSLRDIFEFLFDYAKTTPLTLVVDEFQDIERVNPSLFSDLQNLWDSYKRHTQMRSEERRVGKECRYRWRR